MRKAIIVAAMAASAAVSGAALADGLPSKYVAPAEAYVPAMNWTGFYIGGSLGGMFATSRVTDYDGWYDYGDFSRADTAFIYTGQAGYNWQRGNVVFGVEADISGTTFDTSRTKTDDDFYHKGQWDWIATLRGRVGLAVGNVMPYVTGGVAWVNVKQKYGYSDDYVNFDETVTGFAGGAGVEAALGGPWTLKAEYMYIGLPSQRRVFDGDHIDFASDAHIARVGVNYRLGAGCCSPLESLK